MLEARLRHLPEGARPFVDVLAVAGRPVNSEVVYHAAELSGDELPLVSSLRAAQFLRTGGVGHTLELYHDRIREALAAQLEPRRVMQIHRRLAQAIEMRGIDDPEALFEHYLGAGERVRAATHAAAAARRAAAALAFDRAAAFFRRALELAPARGAELLDLKRGLAEALVNAGRPAEAAQAYLEVAELTPARHSLDFKRRAAQQLLMGGHIDEGLDLIRSVLAAVGLSYPAGPKNALLSLALKRLQIRLRGLSFTERDESQIPEFDLVRVDTCFAVAAGLGAVDLIRGADFQSRHLLLALKAGEPFRVARAIAFEAAWAAARGGAGSERFTRIANQADELAQRVGHPYAIGLCLWARGVEAYLAGNWSRAAVVCEEAADVLRDRCTGSTWELTIANRYKLSALMHMGEIAEVVAARAGVAVRGAGAGKPVWRDGPAHETQPDLAWRGRSGSSTRRGDRSTEIMATPGISLQHYVSLHALTQIELYTGDNEVACKHVEGQWPALEDSLLLRIPAVRVEAMQLRPELRWPRVTTEATAASCDLQRKMADKIEKVNMSWSKPFAALVRATVAHQRNAAKRIHCFRNHSRVRACGDEAACGGGTLAPR
jgi:tetratricopeptide (TPR) repeat protein